MKKIIAFAGSNSTDSINKKLVTYAAHLVEGVEVDILDLNDFELPMYSKQLEAAQGPPKNAKLFLDKIKNADGLIISLAEYNGAYTSVFKNLFDWLSRIEQKLYFNKPLLLLSTAPGGRGGQSVMSMALDRFPRHDANVIGSFSLPFFNENFSDGNITNSELDTELKTLVKQFKNAL